jgi:hypothetical protein
MVVCVRLEVISQVTSTELPPESVAVVAGAGGVETDLKRSLTEAGASHQLQASGHVSEAHVAHPGGTSILRLCISLQVHVQLSRDRLNESMKSFNRCLCRVDSPNSENLQDVHTGKCCSVVLAQGTRVMVVQLCM